LTVLLTTSALERRRAAAAGELRPLADSLAADLEPVLARDLFIPAEKARMTRRGGRCDVDGVLLEFDPFTPRAHRCPQCGRVFDDDAHYRWWIMGYQLWLAERAVHAAALFALRRDARHREFAEAVLTGYADRYLEYENRDNVLGPTRPFFSTYLESIWLLQLAIALDLLESSVTAVGAGHGTVSLGARVRDRLIEPSAALIASFDEGLSNRQTWNNAALLAASRVLHHTLAESALLGPSGLAAHLTRGLLADGTWYEGENYHLFAHRGLWYGVTIAAAAGAELDPALLARFDEAFVTPFVTALPDFTFPSRRDSQYRISLRQWRFAELAELGLVRRCDDARLSGALGTLYDGTPARRDTGRWRSTAEAERNALPSRLDRADLGWRSLLYARPELPRLVASAPRSALLDAQGYAVLRREAGALYAALDYGHSGAGHGHPDRLNLILVHGDDRWLDDVGTGSYVDPSLHWYRSTLAHNAPLVNGRSQERVHGTLSAYEDRGGAGWVRAFADGVAPGVRLERTLVAMPDYLVDELTWRGDQEVTIDLPFHADGELDGVGAWTPATPDGSTEPEDGFAYLTATEAATADTDVRLHARLGEHVADVRVSVDVPHVWWRAVSLGPPGETTRRFHFVRARARRGSIATVWDLRSAVVAVRRFDDVLTVDLANGSRHEHRGDADGWHIALAAGGARSSIDLGGCVRHAPRQEPPPTAPPTRLFVIPRVASPLAGAPGGGAPDRLVFELGEAHYRRSELSWAEAERPAATVAVAADDDNVLLAIDVRKPAVHFAAASEWNDLDNEHPDTNSDGVQLQLIIPPLADSGDRARVYSWLMVPEQGGDRVRVTERATSGPPTDLVASWTRTRTGYELRCAIPLTALGDRRSEPFLLDVIVNETVPGRERRRGQLVLGGAGGEWVYLRGDRHAPDRHLAFVLADV